MTRPPMTPIEIGWLHKICQRFELDTMEIDSSLTYRENKAHLLSLGALSRSSGGLDTLAEREVDRWNAQLEARAHQGSYHKGALCPRCGSPGSGLHVKWVLNQQKRRYEPYFSFAHSVKIEGCYRVRWHYIRKQRAIEILGNTWILEQMNLKQIER